MGKRNNDLLEMSMRDYFNGDISYEAFINDINNFGGVKLTDDAARRIGYFGQQVQNGEQTDAWGRQNIYQSLDEMQGSGTAVTPTTPTTPVAPSNTGTFAGAAQNIVNSAAANKATKENIFSTGSMWDTVNLRSNDLSNFTFDKFKKSDEYKGLKNDYTRNGNLAMRDTLGQIAARTGGLASSYAGGAAQGAYNDYMAKLEEAARQMYQQERNYLADQRDYELSKAMKNYDIMRTERAYADDMLAAQKAEAQDRVANYIGMGGDETKLDSGLITQSGLTDAELQAMKNHFLNGQVKAADDKVTETVVPLQTYPTRAAAINALTDAGISSVDASSIFDEDTWKIAREMTWQEAQGNIANKDYYDLIVNSTSYKDYLSKVVDFLKNNSGQRGSQYNQAKSIVDSIIAVAGVDVALNEIKGLTDIDEKTRKQLIDYVTTMKG